MHRVGTVRSVYRGHRDRLVHRAIRVIRGYQETTPLGGLESKDLRVVLVLVAHAAYPDRTGCRRKIPDHQDRSAKQDHPDRRANADHSGNWVYRECQASKDLTAATVPARAAYKRSSARPYLTSKERTPTDSGLTLTETDKFLLQLQLYFLYHTTFLHLSLMSDSTSNKQ